jgi:hypothetical protein
MVVNLKSNREFNSTPKNNFGGVTASFEILLVSDDQAS